MASVWEVYNDHWAKETHKILKRRVETKKGIEKTIHHLWCWLELMPLETDRPFRICEKELRGSLRGLGFYVEDDEERFKILKAITNSLCPPFVGHELEDDWAFNTLVVQGSGMERGDVTPWYVSPPVEKRFLKNIGGKRWQMHFKEGYDSDRIRALDAIVGFL